MEDPTITKELDNEDKALKSLLDTFGSAFSLEEIASAFCKAGRDATLVGDILCGMQTGPSADATHESNGLINGEISSETPNYNNYDKSHDANRSSSQASKLKRNPTSVGTNSSFSGKEYVWRVVGSNRSPNATKPVKVEMRSVAPVSHASGKNCVWRIAGSNGALNGTELLKLEANDFSVPVNTSEEPLLSRDANLISSDRSSSASDVSSNDDIENFLFEMLGHGSQLERSAIREVLGHCGYDMKKSMETLLALMAENIDKRNQCETNSKGLSFENQVQKQSNESRTMRTNLIPSRISSDSCEQADLIVSAPVLKNATRSWATREIVTEPLNDVAEDCEVKATSLHFNNVKDDAKEGSYYILRKAVKEHRETMKQYYEAATEAFAKGDRGRATLLLEKGQFFYNKAREADEESASKIFETSDGSGDGEMREEMSLDLQDHDAKEAIRLVKIHLRTLSGIPMVRDLKIIIGTGDQDAEKRKRLISKLLQREAIRWIEDETSSAILIRLDEINPKSLSFGRK
ncbi:putative nuclear RNA export factor SDE5 isoform X2 [Chenopodium quinoa]|uniref:putative nuclear RNA export factor SDE5 isoform X2 n=1 Tax=Chenopodium quinoa TaxID=63459 RepID=UPI000B7725B8|nr:putative nuclear RNA export factor SDE5 isoform X2 [Chenopodium quinoa]